MLEAAQHAVEDAAEQPRAQLGAQRAVAQHGGGARAEPAGVLVGLDHRVLAVEGDDLGREALVAQLDEVEHAARRGGRRPR